MTWRRVWTLFLALGALGSVATAVGTWLSRDLPEPECTQGMTLLPHQSCRMTIVIPFHAEPQPGPRRTDTEESY
jgi:hypothetical protein